MVLLGWIQRRRSGKVAERHADRIVARLSRLVRDAALPRAAGLPRAEARGYIRVKALSAVAAHIEKSSDADDAIPSRLRTLVATLATEHLVVELMRLLAHGSSRTATKRRAA